MIRETIRELSPSELDEIFANNTEVGRNECSGIVSKFKTKDDKEFFVLHGFLGKEGKALLIK